MFNITPINRLIKVVLQNIITVYLPGNFFVLNDAFVIIDFETVGVGFTDDNETPIESPAWPNKKKITYNFDLEKCNLKKVNLIKKNFCSKFVFKN